MKLEYLEDYTEQEICSIYRRQEDQSLGVKHLMELTEYSRNRIERILIKGGYTINRTNRNPENCKGVPYDKLYELYKKGYSDRTMANMSQISVTGIRDWRTRNGLILNIKDDKKNERL